MMNRVNLAKSLVAARAIEVGDTIDREAVDIKSPGRGLQPNALDRLVGRTAARTFEPGDFFYASDLGDAAPSGRQYDFKRPWGLPVRYHDIDTMTRDCLPDFLEFHLSYKDLEIDPAAVFAKYDGRIGHGVRVPLPRPVRRRLHPQPGQRGRRPLGTLDRASSRRSSS